ncbi:MAG: DUF1398 domain-containing protein [Hyphomicrobium sp.]|uniref:DUF1398 domain-containing protein n=1 Tax=Hyphomicrobium sp. TaxID=82 RepID=UPI003D13FBC5
MDAHARRVVEECTEASSAATMKFPEIVGRLIDAGVEHYRADLLRGEIAYFMPDGSSHIVPSAALSMTMPAEAFSAPGVEKAVRASQAGEIDFKRFCMEVAAAGCIGYLVSFPGRRVVYYGRTAETHVEPFPSAR